MKKELTYKEALAGLEALVEELEEGTVDLEQLAEKIAAANAFIAICETRLRKVTDEVAAATPAAIKGSGS